VGRSSSSCAPGRACFFNDLWERFERFDPVNFYSQTVKAQDSPDQSHLLGSTMNNWD
jgi:hypothetical protein